MSLLKNLILVIGALTLSSLGHARSLTMYECGNPVVVKLDVLSFNPAAFELIVTKDKQIISKEQVYDRSASTDKLVWKGQKSRLEMAMNEEGASKNNFESLVTYSNNGQLVHAKLFCHLSK